MCVEAIGKQKEFTTFLTTEHNRGKVSEKTKQRFAVESGGFGSKISGNKCGELLSWDFRIQTEDNICGVKLEKS